MPREGEGVGVTNSERPAPSRETGRAQNTSSTESLGAPEDIDIRMPTWTEEWVRTPHGGRRHLIISDLVLVPDFYALDRFSHRLPASLFIDAELFFRGGCQAENYIDWFLSGCCDINDRDDLRPAPDRMPMCKWCAYRAEECADILVQAYEDAFAYPAIQPHLDVLANHFRAVFRGRGPT